MFDGGVSGWVGDERVGERRSARRVLFGERNSVIVMQVDFDEVGLSVVRFDGSVGVAARVCFCRSARVLYGRNEAKLRAQESALLLFKLYERTYSLCFQSTLVTTNTPFISLVPNNPLLPASLKIPCNFL